MLLAAEDIILGKMNTAPMTALTSLSNMGVPTTLTNLSNMGVPTTLTNLSNVGVPSTLTNLSNIAAPSTLTSVTILNELVPLLPYGVPLTPTPVSPSQTMELVWHGEFDRLFTQYYPHAWYLVPTFYPPSDRWRVFKDSAKVRFSCQECGHGWTSMKGRVIFWFHLNYSTNSGYVMFKLYGQQCQKCKNGSYEHAMWYPEEVVKVIGNVYNRVGQVFYGFVRPPLRIDRRQGKPRNQHNAELCQACKEGLCKEEWSFS